LPGLLKFENRIAMANSHPMIGLTPKPLLTESQLACVDLLEEALREARAGNIHAVGIVVCMEGGFASVMAGTRAGDLALGAFDLQCKIREEVIGGNVARPKPKRDTILRVR
jgi:hypothetical protein